MLARHQRRHLVALYLTACNYVSQLEAALLDGVSPTGYGAPLTPLRPARAEAVLAPARRFLQRLREFIVQVAPEELAEYESPQPASNTLVWAANLLERLRQIAEELAPKRLARYGQDVEGFHVPAERFRAELLETLEEACRSLRTLCAG